MKVLSKTQQRMLFNALVDSDRPDGELVPLPCRCTRPHGPHYVRLGRLRPGGDLHGRVSFDDVELR